MPTTQVRRARGAVAALFFTNGLGWANLVPRLPEIKAQLVLSDTLYGASIAVMPVGALIAGLSTAWLIRRFSSARVGVVSTMVLALALVGVTLAPVPALFAASILVVGALDSVTDIAMNAHGLRVQRGYDGRTIINSFHALWSAGAVTGGLMGACALALHLPRGIHLGIVAALLIVAAVVVLKYSLRGPDAVPQQEASQTRMAPPARRTLWLLVGLAVMGMFGMSTEDVGSSWATLYMGSSFGAPGAVAATGFIAMIAAQFLGRMTGDALTDRIGQRAVARLGGAAIIVGMVVALLAPSIPTTLIGFALTGWGACTIIPAVMHVADELPGLRAGSGLTIVTTLMRIGILVSPIVVGAVSDATSLRTALWVMPIAGLAILLLARLLHSRRTG
ncbi:MAG: MFS transporter [Microbacterium sp.]